MLGSVELIHGLHQYSLLGKPPSIQTQCESPWYPNLHLQITVSLSPINGFLKHSGLLQKNLSPCQEILNSNMPLCLSLSHSKNSISKAIYTLKFVNSHDSSQ